MTEYSDKEVKRLRQDKLRVDDLHSIFRCDYDQGFLIWKPRPACLFKTASASRIWNNRFPYCKAGWSNATGYESVKVFSHSYLVHRIIMAMKSGVWPKVVDHINGDPSDNRIKNLRAVDQGANTRNAKLRKDNTSGICGVAFRPEMNKWGAQIWAHGKHHYLGSFHSQDDAISARLAASEKFGFHENHGRISND